MIPGLEYRYRWNDEVWINRREVYPRVKLNRITGLSSIPELYGENEQATRRNGEIPRTAFRTGKTVTMEGAVQAESLDELREFVSEIEGAFYGTSEGQMVATQHPDYGAVGRFFWGRPVMLEIPEEQTVSAQRADHGYSRPFSLGLRLSDPRVYDVVQIAKDSSLVATVGGIAFPITFPFEFEQATNQSGLAVIDNPGKLDTDAVIDLYGPCRLPIIENLTIGAKLRFDNLEIATGDFIRVDFRNRVVLRNGADDWTHKINLTASDWWDAGVPCLIPGENTLRYRGTAITIPPAYAHITFYPAY